MDRREDVSGLRAAPQLRTVRMVAHSGGRRRASRLVCSVKLGEAIAELAGLAKAPEIRWNDRFHRLRFNAQSLKSPHLGLCGFRNDVVVAEQFDLIGREQRRREILQKHRLQSGNRKW